MTKPMRVYVSDLTGRAYATTAYRDLGGGRMVATGAKHDVTADVVETFMAEAWARGWNECNAAAEGDAPVNPYRPPMPPSREPATTTPEEASQG